MSEETPKNIFEIRHQVLNKKGEPREVVYREDDPHKNIEGKRWGSSRSCCYCGDKVVIVRSRGLWGMPGGRIEHGEAIEDAIDREILEETNMRVVRKEFIGYQDIIDPDGAFRNVDWFCEVEPIGPFVADPDISVTEIKLIDPKDVKEYFDWGPMGERIMARSAEIKESKKQNEN